MNKNIVVLIIIIVAATVMYIVSGLPVDKPATACTLEARLCPDGSSVGRSGPKCEFTPCPTIVPKIETEKVMCGGFAGKTCPDGFTCDMEGKYYPDASGVCVKDEDNVKKYKCPETDFVDCIPGPDKPVKVECSDDFLQWAEINCPDFQGAAF